MDGNNSALQVGTNGVGNGYVNSVLYVRKKELEFQVVVQSPFTLW